MRFKLFNSSVTLLCFDFVEICKYKWNKRKTAEKNVRGTGVFAHSSTDCGNMCINNVQCTGYEYHNRKVFWILFRRMISKLNEYPGCWLFVPSASPRHHITGLIEQFDLTRKCEG